MAAWWQVMQTPERLHSSLSTWTYACCQHVPYATLLQYPTSIPYSNTLQQGATARRYSNVLQQGELSSVTGHAGQKSICGVVNCSACCSVNGSCRLHIDCKLTKGLEVIFSRA